MPEGELGLSEEVQGDVSPNVTSGDYAYRPGKHFTPDELRHFYYWQGKLHYDKSDLLMAEKNFLKALEHSESPRDGFFIFKILGFLIRIASERLDERRAVEHIRCAERLMEELSRSLPTLGAEYFYNVGIVQNYQGDFAAAGESYRIACDKARKDGEMGLLCKGLLALMINSYTLKDNSAALAHLRELTALLKTTEKPYLLGVTRFFSGKVYGEMNMERQGLESFSKANEILMEKKCWNLQGHILLEKGILHKRIGQYKEALICFEMAKESNDVAVFKRLNRLIEEQIQDVNDSTIDIYCDWTNRKVVEKTLGVIDFKHRFVLLEILFLLAKNPGISFDKEKLAKHIWAEGDYNPLIHDKLIYTSVSRLRRLIEPNRKKDKKKSASGGAQIEYIIRGKDGYAFNPVAKIRFHGENALFRDKSIGNVDISSPV